MYQFLKVSKTTDSKLQQALKVSSAGIAVLGLLLNAVIARADDINLISNGTFTQTTLTNSGQVTFNPPVTQVADWWTGTGVTLGFLYFPGTQNAQLSDQYGTNNFQLYQGVSNTIPSSPPDGGNFIAVDADPSSVGSFTQTVNGLVPGAPYILTFFQAAGQQAGYSGITTEQWKVTLGTQTILSALMTDPSHDFVPWQQQTLSFTATNTSEYLTFMALGTPDGLPPAVLLADVSLVDPPSGPVDAPEPSTAGLFTFGLIGMLFLAARIRKRQLTP